MWDNTSAITSSRDPSTGSAPTVLRVSRLTVRFGDMTILQDIDLAVRRGELVTVIGENGAGKSTLMRCIVGDLAPTAGVVEVGGRRVGANLTVLKHADVGVVWQTAAQCDNLDVASNLLLGRERRWMMRSESSAHAEAAKILADLAIPVRDTTRPMYTLPRGEQQLVAIARAVRDRPSLLVLDEPAGSLGVRESELIEQLIRRLHRGGTSIVLVSHDISQIMRLADRVVVLRRGIVVADLPPTSSHPDDIAALVAGQEVDSSARRQLVRLQGLVDQLASMDASLGLPLVATALAAALGVDRLCLHRAEQDVLTSAWLLGFPDEWTEKLSRLPMGDDGGPTGIAAMAGRPAVDLDGSLRERVGWPLAEGSRPGACYAVPVTGSAELLGVITVFRTEPGAPTKDELDLVALYAGYVASVIERQEADVARQEATALRRSHDLQRQFLLRLSHELRTPLTAIRGYASSLAQQDVVWDSASTERFVGRISDESDRLSRLVGDLLDFSAIESGVLRLSPDWCDMGLVLRAARECLPLASADRVAITYEPGLPRLWADHDRLEQVFVNLFVNAIRHNPPDTTVAVMVTAAAGGAVITVTDNGIGLPAAELGSAPGAYVRRPTSGSGLGLSITRGIIQAHGGKVAVESSEAGTRFTITLLEDAQIDSWEEDAE